MQLYFFLSSLCKVFFISTAQLSSLGPWLAYKMKIVPTEIRLQVNRDEMTDSTLTSLL